MDSGELLGIHYLVQVLGTGAILKTLLPKIKDSLLVRGSRSRLPGPCTESFSEAVWMLC